MKHEEWIYRENWKMWISASPAIPGVWKRKEGGYVVRRKAKDPRSGKPKDRRIIIEKARSPQDALKQAQEAISRQLSPASGQVGTLPTLKDYAASLLERKIVKKKLKSRKSREKWASILALHIGQAPFAEYRLDAIYKADIEAWTTELQKLVDARQYSPVTVNDWLKILRTIFAAAVDDFKLDRNPMMHVEDIDTSEHETYTPEQPNSLTPDELPMFLGRMREIYPQHYAMTFLGFVTGLRPSHMRPIRRSGAVSDIDWEKKILYVRRSVSRGTVMNRTKTAKRQAIGVPDELLAVLRWQVERLEHGNYLEQSSDLLFPIKRAGRKGGEFQADATLSEPFDMVTKACGFAKRITPKAMRRTFQDLFRMAEVSDIVARSICGHETEEMQEHYSTVHAGEQRSALAKVISMLDFRREPEPPAAEVDSGQSSNPVDLIKESDVREVPRSGGNMAKVDSGVYRRRLGGL